MHPPLHLFALQGPTGEPIADGLRADAQDLGGFGHGVSRHIARSTALPHGPMVDASQSPRKPLEAILAALSGIPVPYGPADGATGSYLCKNPAPLAGTGHYGLGSVDTLREEIE